MEQLSPYGTTTEPMLQNLQVTTPEDLTCRACVPTREVTAMSVHRNKEYHSPRESLSEAAKTRSDKNQSNFFKVIIQNT